MKPMTDIFVLAVLLCLTAAQYTLDCCRTDADCDGPRNCMFFEPPTTFIPCQPNLEDCRCSQGISGIILCKDDSDCLRGDICKPAGFDNESFCLTPRNLVPVCEDSFLSPAPTMPFETIEPGSDEFEASPEEDELMPSMQAALVPTADVVFHEGMGRADINA